MSSNTTNPYLDGKREWMEANGSIIKQAFIWRIFALVCLALVAFLIFALVSIAHQSKVQPFIVQVDKLGGAVAVGPADKATLPDEKIIRFQLANYITNARQVTSDTVVQKRWLDAVYAMSSPATTNFLNQYFKDHDPFAIAQTGMMDVEVQSALPQSKDTWEVQWQETRRAQTGEAVDVTHWKGLLKISTFVPTNAAEIMRNPTGVVVTEIHWTQQL